MARGPDQIAGFTVLPVRFPKSTASPAATHYIYLKPHDPKLPDPAASRSLFLVNVPVTASESHLKHLFNVQIAAGRVEEVYFGEARSQKSSVISQARAAQQSKSRKRKRETVEDLESALDSCELPRIWANDLHSTGAHAVVVFVDRSSMEASLKASKRLAKKNSELMWADGLEDAARSFGLRRYEVHSDLLYPSRKELLHSVDEFMTTFNKLEEARLKADAKRRQMPDDDGFVTVTRGTRGGVIRADEAKELGEKQKAKNKGLEDFYRFQMREKRKEEQGQLIKQFEEDRRKLEEMRRRRGKLRPE